MMTQADVVIRQHEEFPSLYVFHCKTLSADISQAACAANYANRGTRSVSCQGCKVHEKNVERTKLDVLNDPNADRHLRFAAANGLGCIRCLRDETTNKRLINRMRLIRSKTICVSCWNREREITNNGGLNSKGAPARKWGACLRPTSLVIRLESGKLDTVDIGLSTGPSEARRHAERRQFDLVQIWIDGERGEDMLDMLPRTAEQWARGKNSKLEPKPPKAPKVKKPPRIATAREAAETEDREPRGKLSPAWSSVFGDDLDDEPVSTKRSAGRRAPLPPMTPEQALAYERSFDQDDAEPVAEIAATIASPKPIEPVVGTLTWRGRALTDIAAERGEDLAVIETRMLATDSPFPDAHKAVRPPPAIAPAVRPQAPAELRRVFHPLLKRLSFEPGKLYGSVMPLAVDQYMGKKSIVLFGCLCATTFKAPAQAVLRGHTTSCGCGAKPEPAQPAHDLAAYLRTLKAPPPYRPWLSTTCWHRIQVGTYAYARSVS
ncbi:hypothetical protein [Caballeronia mineralivorans]|nr:hypothetical protein [Caballeronia mineralivorans]